jgi:radical SAM/Cys-rich protein
MHETLPLLQETDFPKLTRARLDTLQVNLGYLCNQQCVHCHVNAGPNRREIMTQDTVQQVLAVLDSLSIETLDLTGGAPELNPHFRMLVVEARRLGVTVIDRCNLTVLEEPAQEDLAGFLARNQVEIVSSLPCYSQKNVDTQRGKGVFEKSIRGLQALNRLGYGQLDNPLKLSLVFNPMGPDLPPAQDGLSHDYKQHLWDDYQVVFNQLYTLVNMPIQRFGSLLISKGTFKDYMQLLKTSYEADNLSAVMCRSLISVDWQGYLYDCDFNQMLALPLISNQYKKPHLSDLVHMKLAGSDIVVADHCYGCTAGQGSSCGGALL